MRAVEAIAFFFLLVIFSSLFTLMLYVVSYAVGVIAAGCAGYSIVADIVEFARKTIALIALLVIIAFLASALALALEQESHVHL